MSQCCTEQVENMTNVLDCANGLPKDAVAGIAYVPWQRFKKTYEPKMALMAGTIFPELDKPFTGVCQGGRCR